MELTLQCIINNQAISADVNPGTVVLDFLRRNEQLTGTKEGCREGDCGACTILVGELVGNEVLYKSVNSCLMPLGDAHGKHLVTIEGVNQPKELNPIQEIFVDDGGTQCGFCTPGFIMSLTGYCLNHSHGDVEEAIDAVDGNICRCTGHPPIKKAIHHIVEFLKKNPHSNGVSIAHLVEQKILPEYFLAIPHRLKEIQSTGDIPGNGHQRKVVAGGTDVYVQRAFTMHLNPVKRISAWKNEEKISEEKDTIRIAGTTTVEEFRNSDIVKKHFPHLPKQLELFGSTPIRNRATIAGNIVNASPIGDMTCVLMALNGQIHLWEDETERVIPLRKFYLGYKKIDKRERELIASVTIQKPAAHTLVNFEKVSRRQHLDIASVNSTMACQVNGEMLSSVSISAGGIGPVPTFLSRTSDILTGKILSNEVLENAFAVAQTEISPISDARGTVEYKRLLLRQLLAAHVMQIFPKSVTKESLV